MRRWMGVSGLMMKGSSRSGRTQPSSKGGPSGRATALRNSLNTSASDSLTAPGAGMLVLRCRSCVATSRSGIQVERNGTRHKGQVGLAFRVDAQGGRQQLRPEMRI